MILGVVFVFVLLFGFVVFRGAPYLPTMHRQANSALELLDLKQGQMLLELGSGDGGVLVAAAKRGLHAVGYELNPVLVIISKVRCWRYRKQVRIVWGDFWLSDWPPSDGLYVFLLDRYMRKLDKKIVHYTKNRPYKVVSNTFKIPDRAVAKSHNGQLLYLYK